MKVNGDRNECRQDIQARLKKIEGQVRGISRMVDEERDCKDIMVQLTAVKAAISQVGVLVLTNYLANCLGEDLVKDQSVQENLDKFSDLLRKWS
ncbi:MAG: metal-sensitive transcriptional regulator [Syntrophomonadales bacterium]|jgi:DNA-binding FrmR family transcriptional regulator